MKHTTYFTLLLVVLTGCESATDAPRLDAEPAVPSQSWVLATESLPHDVAPQVVNEVAVTAMLQAQQISDETSWSEAISRAEHFLSTYESSPAADIARQAVALAMLSRPDAKRHSVEMAPYVETLIRTKNQEVGVIAPALEALRGTWNEERLDAAAREVLATVSEAAPCANCGSDERVLQDLGVTAPPKSAASDEAIGQLRRLTAG